MAKGSVRNQGGAGPFAERPVGFDAGSKLPASAEGPREAADKASMLVGATGLSTAGAQCAVAGIHDVVVQPSGPTPETLSTPCKVLRLAERPRGASVAEGAFFSQTIRSAWGGLC
jgi:hypothetical protein